MCRPIEDQLRSVSAVAPSVFEAELELPSEQEPGQSAWWSDHWLLIQVSELPCTAELVLGLELPTEQLVESEQLGLVLVPAVELVVHLAALPVAEVVVEEVV